MSDILITPEMGNGLRECTVEDLECMNVLMASAIPLSVMWKEKNNDSKIISWDSELEDYLAHRAKLIDNEGREKMMPYNLYKSLGLNWVMGYNYIQRIGDCASFGARNSLKASDLVNMYFTKRKAIDVHPSITYCYSRGNGRFSWGSGENLNPLQSWLAKLGNFSIDDMGKYTGSKPRQPNDQEKQNALKHQSIIIPLPDTKFDTVYKICAAGFGVEIGTSIYPSSAKLDKNGLMVPNRLSKGGHATACCGALEKNNTRYIWWENSHGDRYGVGETGHPSGCFVDEGAWGQIKTSGFSYGNDFANVGELIP